jgi:hypothetical protein
MSAAEKLLQSSTTTSLMREGRVRTDHEARGRTKLDNVRLLLLLPHLEDGRKNVTSELSNVGSERGLWIQSRAVSMRSKLEILEQKKLTPADPFVHLGPSVISWKVVMKPSRAATELFRMPSDHSFSRPGRSARTTAST